MMTCEQLLTQIRAGNLNLVLYRDQYNEQYKLLTFYNVLYTLEQHEEILATLNEDPYTICAAIAVNRVDVCIDQAGHAPHHYHVENVAHPHMRCRECERIRDKIRPKNEEELKAYRVTILQKVS